jgi:hypothetical protein
VQVRGQEQQPFPLAQIFLQNLAHPLRLRAA